MRDLETTFGTPGCTEATIRVASELARRFTVGSRWVVVSHSKESLWDGEYTVRLETVGPEGDEG